MSKIRSGQTKPAGLIGFSRVNCISGLVSVPSPANPLGLGFSDSSTGRVGFYNYGSQSTITSSLAHSHRDRGAAIHDPKSWVTGDLGSPLGAWDAVRSLEERREELANPSRHWFASSSSLPSPLLSISSMPKSRGEE